MIDIIPLSSCMEQQFHEKVHAESCLFSLPEKY